MRINPIENMTDGETTSKPKDVFHPKALRETQLSCPVCSSIILYNVNTQRYRCRKCSMVFPDKVIKRLLRKQELREQLLKWQMS